MHSFFKTGILTLLATAFFAVSCQDSSITEDNTDALGPASQLTGLLSAMSSNETNTINAVDSTACFNIKLPVTVIANYQQITVTTENDYAVVAAIFNQSNNDTDNLTYVYPITIVYPNYSEVLVSSAQEYNSLIATCNSSPGYISSDCVAINFPITVFGYNSSFQMENTYTLNNNAELYTMLLSLQANEYYSISYPVSVTVAGQQILTVTNNAELQQAVNDAVANCTISPQTPVGCTNPGVLTEGLIIYMPFSHSVTDLKGSVVIAPADTTFVADRDSNPRCAISFNGSQSLQIGSNAANSLVTGDALSVSLWFKMQNTVIDNLEHMFTKGSGGAGGFNVSVYDGNTPMFTITGIAQTANNQIWDLNWNQNASLINDTTNWHHLVITLNTNNEAKLYRDGALQNTLSLTNSSIGATALDYFIGQGFTGYLDDLRVYKKILTATDVQTLFELEGDCNSCLE